MQFTGVQVFAFFMLIVGTAMIIASLGTSHWVREDYSLGTTAIEMYEVRFGFWQFCTRVFGIGSITVDTDGIHNDFKCANRITALINRAREGHNPFNLENNAALTPLEIVALLLLSASVVIGILSLMCAPCCCTRCACCLTLWVLLCVLCSMSGMGLYTFIMLTAKPDDPQTVHFTRSFDWSYWLAIGGSVAQLISALCYAVSRARIQSYSHI